MITLAADLRATRRWIEINTMCSQQRSEGWYARDCIERKSTPKCERCKILVRLDRQLRELSAAVD